MTDIIGKSEQERLKELAGEYISFSEPMSRHTTFRTGGKAAVFARPGSIAELEALLDWAAEKKIACEVIGGGSNLLVKDGGFAGILINLSRCTDAGFRPENGKEGSVLLRVSAGSGLRAFCGFAVRNRLEGTEGLLGIPGSVGGGIRMNAGTALGCISDILESVRIMLPGGQSREMKRSEMNFSYRSLCWNADGIAPEGREPLILEAVFRLQKSRESVGECKARARQIMEKRKKTQPWQFPSAGCFFKNPPGLSAGKLIDSLGLKGKRAGGAEVSCKHANFIINRHRASASDILALAELLQKSVCKKFGIRLEREVKVIGQ